MYLRCAVRRHSANAAGTLRSNANRAHNAARCRSANVCETHAQNVRDNASARIFGRQTAAIEKTERARRCFCATTAQMKKAALAKANVPSAESNAKKAEKE